MARGIFKRPNSGNYWIRYAGPDGSIIRESSETDNFKEAEKLLRKRKEAVDEGKLQEIKKISNYTFRELAELYQEWIIGRQASAKNKKYIINRHLLKYGNLPLKSFSTMIVEQLQTELKKDLKNASCNKVLNVLKHMFTKAFEWDMVSEDILKRVRKVKLFLDDGKRLRYLSREECQALIGACDGHIKPIVATALNTGMRRGEILNLKWDNVDLKHSFILLDKTKNGERREIPINATLKNIFSTLYQGTAERPRRIDVAYVFYEARTGKAYKEVKRSFHSALKKATVSKCTSCDYQSAIEEEPKDKSIEFCPQCSSEMNTHKGINDFHFHDLRHTFASHLVMSGIDLTTVSRLLGHKDIKMTLRYSHLAPSHIKNAVNVLDTTLNGQKAKLTQLVAQSGGK